MFFAGTFFVFPVVLFIYYYQKYRNKLGKQTRKLFFLILCENIYKTCSKVSQTVILVMVCAFLLKKKKKNG